MSELKVKPGLYRHFKGSYFFVQNIVKDCTSGEPMCYYFNVLHPEYGFFVRPVYEWFDTVTGTPESSIPICERPDNTTGQTYRFEKVDSIDFQISNVSTEQLVRELLSREDSPIRDLDIKGLESASVFCRDYIVGIPRTFTPTNENYIMNWTAFPTKKEAEECIRKNRTNSYKVFKRVLLIEDD